MIPGMHASGQGHPMPRRPHSGCCDVFTVGSNRTALGSEIEVCKSHGKESATYQSEADKPD